MHNSSIGVPTTSIQHTTECIQRYPYDSRVIDLNSPTACQHAVETTHSDDDEMYEVYTYYSECYDIIEEVFNPNKTAVAMIFDQVSKGILMDGIHWSEPVIDLCTRYGWCPSEIYPVVKRMAEFGMIQLETDDRLPCKCDACYASVSSYGPAINFMPALSLHRRREATEQEFRMIEMVQPSRRSVGWVYLIKCGDRFKIGVSRHLDNRINQLKGQSPYPLELAHSAKGESYREMESRLHVMFNHRRVHGEWFKLNPDEVQKVIRAMDEWQNGTEG